jgi:hypothetical protein
MLRRLRIAASVFFGVLTIAVIALWVRSYWYLDLWSRDNPSLQQVISVRGLCQLQTETRSRPGAIPTKWHLESFPANALSIRRTSPWMQFPKVVGGGNRVNVRIPYWSVTAAFLALALAPTLRFRFTTRTLLIATTLVAIVLGAGVWAMR